MIDRTSKLLLTAIALSLLALLLRPMLAPVPAQAQSTSAETTQAQTSIAPVSVATQMVVSNGEIFILQDGKLSVYQEESATSRKLAKELGVNPNDPVSLRRIATMDVNKP